VDVIKVNIRKHIAHYIVEDCRSIRIVPISLEDFEITALGRCAEPPLMEAALVSVWDTKSQECLASALVGPTSRVDGFYAWEPLMEPLLLKKGQEYRLSQPLGIPWHSLAFLGIPWLKLQQETPH
jgi:hypothetical protein